MVNRSSLPSANDKKKQVDSRRRARNEVSQYAAHVLCCAGARRMLHTCTKYGQGSGDDSHGRNCAARDGMPSHATVHIVWY